MESVNAYLGSQELVAKSFAKRGIGDRTVINHVNAIVLITFVIQLMDAYADPDIEVSKYLKLFVLPIFITII